jgi:hypothetical protein
VLLILSAGCSSRGTISGKVTINDQPVHRGTITFYTLDKSWASAASIGEDGSYTIAKVPLGPVKISVVSAERNPRLGAKFKARSTLAPGEANAEDVPPKFRNRFNPEASGPSVPKKYNDPETSGLTYEVKPGKQEHNIDIK